MSVQRVNFTSSLLDKNNNEAVKTENKVVQQPKLEEKPDEFVSTAEEAEVQEKPSHKIRNWTIGIGSVAALAGLFFAGRAGKLGKGIQKFLGGVKKEVEEAAGHSKPRVTETEEEISIEEFERIKNKDTDFTAGGNKKTNETILEEPAGSKQEKSPKAEEKKVTKKEETPEPKAAETPALTPKQIELNAKLDRVPPYIDPDFLHHDFPTPERLYKHLGIDMKEIEKIDISKFEDWTETSLRYKMELPNNRSITIFRNKNNINEISGIDVYDNDKIVGSVTIYTDKSKTFYGDIRVRFNYDNGSNIHYDYKKGGVKYSIEYKHQNGNSYGYDEKGNLNNFSESPKKDTEFYRTIYMENDKLDHIVYRDKKTHKWLKMDYFDETDKITKETFNNELTW